MKLLLGLLLGSMALGCTTSPLPTPGTQAQAARPDVVLCKPCGDPIETALIQASAIALGETTSKLDPEPVAQQAGRASLGFRVREWLRTPSGTGSKAFPRKIQVHFSWDGACKAPPPPFRSGEKLILFMSHQDEIWQAVPGACAQGYLYPGPSEIDLKALRKRLGKRLPETSI